MNPAKTKEKYFVSIRPQTDGIHSIHREGCPFMPDDAKRIYVGDFDNGDDAHRESKQHFPGSACCRFCIKSEKDERIQRKAERFMPSVEQLAGFSLGKTMYIFN